MACELNPLPLPPHAAGDEKQIPEFWLMAFMNHDKVSAGHWPAMDTTDMLWQARKS
jgi:hypothetical protein